MPGRYDLRMSHSQTCFLRQLLKAAPPKEKGERICETDRMKYWVSRKAECLPSNWIQGGPTRGRCQTQKRRDWRVSEWQSPCKLSPTKKSALVSFNSTLVKSCEIKEVKTMWRREVRLRSQNITNQTPVVLKMKELGKFVQRCSSLRTTLFFTGVHLQVTNDMGKSIKRCIQKLPGKAKKN